MNVILAPDSFKGSMTSIALIGAIRGVMERHLENLDIVEVPIADGGEGTIDALIHSGNGHQSFARVEDPLGRLIDAPYGLVDETAIVEMACTSGLTLMNPWERNPLLASTYGTGQMIQHVMEKGYRKIVIGIGGSGTNDGGTGAMQALGVRFYDKENIEILRMSGSRLKDIARIDLSEMDPRIAECQISVMCDVNNPLTGERGATKVYGPQKGATGDMLVLLEEGMCHYREVLKQTFGRDIGALPGTGAAGGIGAALLAFLEAELISGIDKVLELAGFEERLAEADLVITGEGRIDEQSAQGKVIHGIVTAANEYEVPVIALTGGVGDGMDKVYDLGVKAVFPIPNRPMDLETAMSETRALVEQTTRNICSIIHLKQHKIHKDPLKVL